MPCSESRSAGTTSTWISSENLIFRSLRCVHEDELSLLGALHNSEMEDHIKHCLDESQFKRLDPRHLRRLDEEIDFAKMSKNPRNLQNTRDVNTEVKKLMKVLVQDTDRYI